MRVDLQAAYVLHSRLYRDSSLLLDLFTRENGRVSAVARGARGARSRTKGLLQPFVSLVVSWVGKSELVTLTTVETEGLFHTLRGRALLSAFYLNELLVRVLQPHDACPTLYDFYQKTLMNLQQDSSIEQTLRLFEKQLLSELGYGMQLTREFETNRPVLPHLSYYFRPEQGLVLCDENLSVRVNSLFQGENLLAFHANTLHNPTILRDAKRLIRLALAPLLGNKPLRTRELFNTYSS